ncbi:MAG TPA: hypothetical protein VGG34_07975 [Opitutaceae bacterium]
MIKTYQRLQLLIAATCVCAAAHANKGPASKIYVADTIGETQIDTGNEVDDLTKRSVYSAEGTTIGTKANSNASVVFSNGTGVFFDVDTQVQIKTFEQEAFKPNRTDIEDEPSVSETRIVLDHGVVGISTSKPVAGSTTVYETPLATAEIRGRQAVILSEDNLTVISMVQGEATVQPGPLGPPLLIKNRQQIIIKPGKKDGENVYVIQDIPDGQAEDDEAWVEERVLTADAARKLVYFETQDVKSDSGTVSVFDGADGANSSSGANSGNKEIVPVPVVPENPTVQPNVSPANLVSG